MVTQHNHLAAQLREQMSLSPAVQSHSLWPWSMSWWVQVPCRIYLPVIAAESCTCSMCMMQVGALVGTVEGGIDAGRMLLQYPARLIQVLRPPADGCWGHSRSVLLCESYVAGQVTACNCRWSSMSFASS